MFRLRARVFRDRMRWDVQVDESGRERDWLDNEGPAYVLYTDAEKQKLFGSLRLLPMTGPTLIHDAFPDTLPENLPIDNGRWWECSRFCVDETLYDEHHADELVFASNRLFTGLGEVALRAGMESILGNFNAPMRRVYRRAGVEMKIIGSSKRFNPTVFLGEFPVSPENLELIRSKFPD
jgi:N-acyl-L-homoserine lactone synthetase